MGLTDHAIYFLLWVSFGLVHSLLAGNSCKQFMKPWLGAGYRLCYNGLAAAHIALVLLAGHSLAHPQAVDVALSPHGRTLLTGLRWSGLLVIAVSLLHYDLARFSGLRQIARAIRGHGSGEGESLHVTGLHRYVRHPLYAGAYLYLWGGAGDELGLATALWASLYLAIGTRVEERRLVREHGSAYTEYRARVPALVPYKGRAI